MIPPPKNIPGIDKLAGVVDLFLEHSSRINERQARRYWYPLSMATYGAEEILQALDSLCSFRTSMWEKTQEFETRFAAHLGARRAVMVNSGSSADLLASLLLVDPTRPLLRPGDEVIAPVVTWPTQLWSVKMAGLGLVLADVDPETLNVDLADLERCITGRTRAISLVHLMGNPCDMDAVRRLADRHGLLVLEDCCEALDSAFGGTKVGNFGLASTFSFFFSHHMTTMEGGMVACRDEDVADRLKILRAHGWLRNVPADGYDLATEGIDPRYAFVNWGLNVRPTDVQAGFGLCQLERLPGFGARRRALAERFRAALAGSPFVAVPRVHPRADPCWFALPMMVREGAPFGRDALAAHLESVGVETRPIVAGNVARHPVARLFPEFRSRPFPGADQVHRRGLYVGLSPVFGDELVDRLVGEIQAFVGRFG